MQVVFDSTTQHRKISIRVYPEDDEGMIREALNIISENEVVIGNIEGIRIMGIGHKEETPPVIITLIRNSPYLYIFEGTGDIFDKMLSTLKFIQ